MAATLQFRHNLPPVKSLEEFQRFRGGIRMGTRGVCFVRALGTTPDLVQRVEAMDRALGQEAAQQHLQYLRVSGLPRLTQEGTAFYMNAHQQWTSGAPICLRTSVQNPLLQQALQNATRSAEGLYRNSRAGITDTMARNFVIKLWFWTDSLLSEVLSRWSETGCVKMVATDIGREQEYLFFYYATLLCCDVLLLNSRADTAAGPSLLGLSSSFRLGAFGSVTFPAYVPPKPATRTGTTSRTARPASRTGSGTGPTRPSAPVSNSAASPSSAYTRAGTAPSPLQVRVTIPSRAPQTQGRNPQSGTGNPAPGRAQTGSHQQTPVGNTRTQQNPVQRGVRQEKSYEELAALASSIVMIGVVDPKLRDLSRTREVPIVSSGSGIMIGRQGFLLTNFHVIREGRIFVVRVEEDEQVYVTTEVIKYHPDLDLAVLRIERTLKPLPIFNGPGELARGQKVVAIGSPLGLFNSVSDGIISGFRQIDKKRMIQFTAPISPGSSGGAVLNMYGEVIGISTAGIDSGQNINLAVSYEDIRSFARGFYDT